MSSELRSRRSILGLPWSAAFLVAGAIFSSPAQAEQTIAEDLTVQGVLKLDDPAAAPMLYFQGTPASGVSTGAVGASISYLDGTIGSITYKINRLGAVWNWQAATTNLGTDRLQMKLDNGNILSLMDPASGSASIILDPQSVDPKITINGARVATIAEVAASYVPLYNPNAIVIPSVYGGAVDTDTYTRIDATGVFNANPNGGGWFQGYDETINAIALRAYYDPRSPGIAFQTLNNQVGLMIAREGNVGVGTTTPTDPLTVMGKIRSTVGLKVDDGTPFFPTTNYGGSGTISSSRPTAIALGAQVWTLQVGGAKNDADPSTALLSSNADGSNPYVYFEMGRAAGLDKTGYNVFFDPYGQSGVWVGNVLRVQSGAVLAAQTGNVGVGTTAPAAKLDVNGSSRFSGPSRFDGRVRIAPQGDIGMGDFQAEPAP